MIYFRTCAYNAEKTIRRTVESVLSQTIPDFKYYILDNGSTDSTRAIIDEYAERDDRIVVFYNKVNRKLEENPSFWTLSNDINDDDYLAFLDADDSYEENFLKSMLEFMEKNSLDVAACGSYFENEDGVVGGKIIQQQDFLLRNATEYDTYFPFVHWNMRQVWGKLYKGSVVKHKYEIDTPEWWPKAYGGDTVNVMNCLRYSKGFGVLAKGLHHYQVSQKSVSYQWMEGREDSDLILDRFAREFLMEKAGRISEDNQRFLAIVYMNALKDTLNVLLNSNQTNAKIMQVSSKIFDEQTTREVLGVTYENGAGEKEKKDLLIYRKVLLEWAISNYTTFDKTDKHHAYVFLSAHGDVIRDIISEQESYDLFGNKPELIKAIVNGQVGSIIRLLQEYVQEKQSLDMLQIENIVFAQNLSAFLGLEDLYTAYSKLYIAELINQGCVEEAGRELSEWLSILPGDEEFINLRSRIEG